MRLFLLLYFSFVSMFAMGNEYINYTKKLMKYKLDLDYSISNAFYEEDKNKRVVVLKKDENLSKKENNITKEKPLPLFELYSIFNNRAYIYYSYENKSSKKWYRVNQVIGNDYHVTKISKRYVEIGNGKISKIISFPKQKNKCLKVRK